MDMSVAAYVKQERLNAAKKLLVETSRPINVIARESGYSSSFILSRTLKRNAGMSPRAYRQKHSEIFPHWGRTTVSADSSGVYLLLIYIIPQLSKFPHDQELRCPTGYLEH